MASRASPFARSIARFGTPDFAAALAADIAALPVDAPPLAGAGDQGGIIEPGSVRASLLDATGDDRCIDARVGIFFNEIVGGCSCGDEPFATACRRVLRLHIDRTTGSVEFCLDEN